NGFYSLFRRGILKKLLCYLRNNPVDIIQTFFIDAIYLGVLAGKLANVPVIINSRRDMGYWYTPLNLKMLRLFSKVSNAILVNSKAVKENVVKKEHVEDFKVHVIYNGIDSKAFERKEESRREMRKSMGIGSEEVVLGLISNLRPVKRVDIFVRSLHILNKKFKNWKGLIIGDGPLRSEIEWLVSSCELNDKVIFAGSISDTALYCNIMDIGVLSSESEGFSNSLLEQMASGLAIVATRTGGNIELIEGAGGILVPVNDSLDMARGLEILATNESYRRELGYKSRAWSVQFSWNKIMKDYEDFYTAMVSLNRDRKLEMRKL
ncbi:glycosyltransferase, partial [bacterium]|nr:glycosyltransferase [bacterium]